MKKILTLIGVSILGGALTLGGYKLMEPDSPKDFQTYHQSQLLHILALLFDKFLLLENLEEYHIEELILYYLILMN